MADAALSFRNVSCVLDGKRVVDDVSFDIAAGEIMCLFGASGCGKTTSLRLAGGIETPSAGEIFLNGALVSTPQDIVPPEQRGIGFLFQDYALFPHLSVLDNVCFGIKNLPDEARKSRALDLLSAVSLEDKADKFPSILSGGEQQRVALARALAPKPALVLMDEPFSHLDQSLRNGMRDITAVLLNDTRAAGLIVTHDLSDALRMTNKIAVQQKGRIVQMDTPQEVYANPQNADVAHLLGMVNITKGAEWFYPHDIMCSGDDGDFTFEAQVDICEPIGEDWLCDMNVKASDGISYFHRVLINDGNAEDLVGKEYHTFFVPRSKLVLFRE